MPNITPIANIHQSSPTILYSEYQPGETRALLNPYSSTAQFFSALANTKECLMISNIQIIRKDQIHIAKDSKTQSCFCTLLKHFVNLSHIFMGIRKKFISRIY